DLSSNPSICTGCSRGCNIDIWVKNNEILRLTPRFNEEVNSYWMCDDGRLNTFKHVNADNRVDGTHLRKDGQLIEVGWDEAYASASSELKNISNKEIAFIGSAFSTCEDNYLLTKFTKDVIGCKNIDFIRHTDPDFGDELLRQNDITPNTMGAELTGVSPKQGGLDLDGIVQGIKSGKIKGLFVMEDDLLEAYPELEKSLPNLELLIVLTSNFNKITAFADFVFPAATFAEKNGTFINFKGRVQRIKPAVETTEMDRSLDGMAMSRLDKFGTSFDRWAKGNKRDARASWKIISGLSILFDKKLKYKMAENVFDDMSKNIDAFKGLDYDIMGEKLKTPTPFLPAYKV
ncbi:MAG TPA: NADH-quinone oxidoreductase subunit G, partial [Ignavibacteria bacterium]|nr:NADH-quinone oxidoreductase subunit G [Ignavibacteria bacterium]